MAGGVDTSALDRRIAQATHKLRRVVRNAANDTAFQVRKDTPGLLADGRIDRPKPFTVASAVAKVDRASTDTDRVVATLSITEARARYLVKLEKGVNERNKMMPISAQAGDKHGNVKKAFNLGPATKQVLLSKTDSKGRKKYFAGKPVGGNRPAGIYERKYARGGNTLKLHVLFIKRRRMEPRLGLRDRWKRDGASLLADKIREQRARPENQL
jgi:hypothetical protein